MSRDKNGIPHLFDHWNEISTRIRSANDIRLFLDFDGTLVPYRAKPEDVSLNARAKRILKQLGRHRRVHVAIVSGRRNSVLRQLIRVPRIRFMGLYGSEYTGSLHLSRKARRALDAARAILASLPVEFPGVLLEDKGVSFAIHSRGVSPGVRQKLQWRVRKALIHSRADFHLIRGGHSWEIVPWQVRGKGVAMREFTRSLRSPFLPVYVGDDLTDEPAFKVLRRGVTIRVGAKARTNARFRVNDPGEIHTFLERLEKELP